MATKNKRRALRAPFLITVTATAAAAVATLPACMSTTTTNPPGTFVDCPEEPPSTGDPCAFEEGVCSYGDGACGPSTFHCAAGEWVMNTSPPCNPPPPPVCPEEQPVSGSACVEVGQTCPYTPVDSCTESVEAVCADLQWMIVAKVDPLCNPPAPCPGEVPVQGEPCEDFGPCSYVVDSICGQVPVDATCSSNGTWEVNQPVCNPPPPGFCSQYVTSGECLADSACDWQVPGCGETPLPAAGCFDVTPCRLGGFCPDGNTCQTVVVDPCWDSNCDACGMDMNLCLPSK